MPIRDVGSNYRNKIHQMMVDVDNIKHNLSEGSYVRISYPSERQIIYMRADKITPVESSFYGMGVYEGIIDLSFQGPAYVYTYDEFENPINLECYENYNLNNAINRNTSGTTDDPDDMEIITYTDFHDTFMGLMDKFYFNNYIWPTESEMYSSAYIKDYKMAMFFKKNEIRYQFLVSGSYKIDIIFQIPGNLSRGGKISFAFKEEHTLDLTIDGKDKFDLVYDGNSIYYYNFDFFEGDKYYQEDKFHVVVRYLYNSHSGYIYIESLRTGKRTYSVLPDIRLSIGGRNGDIIIYSDPVIGIERLRMWNNDSLAVDIVPLEGRSQYPALYDLIPPSRVAENQDGFIENW